MGEQMDISSKAYCVYSDTGSSVTVTGLKSNTKYFAAVYEFNHKAGGYYEYLTSCYPEKDTITFNIVADFSMTPTSQCFNDNFITFKNKSTSDITPVTYKWDFDDGQTSNNNDETHIYKNPGIYFVKLEAFAEGCTRTKVINDTIQPHPKTRFHLDYYQPDNDSFQCLYGNRFIFKNETTVISLNAPIAVLFNWSSETLKASSHKASFSYLTPGLKTVKLVAGTKYKCKDSMSITYKVFQTAFDPSKVSVSPRSMSVTGNLFTFTNNNPASVTHKWYLTNKFNTKLNVMIEGQTVNYSFKEQGTYYVLLRTEDSLDNCTDHFRDSVFVIPLAGISHSNLMPAISVYPNPSQSGNFQINELPVDAALTLYNIIGKELSPLYVSPDKSQINISSFGPGTYILRIWSNGVRYDHRLVVF